MEDVRAGSIKLGLVLKPASDGKDPSKVGPEQRTGTAADGERAIRVLMMKLRVRGGWPGKPKQFCAFPVKSRRN